MKGYFLFFLILCLFFQEGFTQKKPFQNSFFLDNEKDGPFPLFSLDSIFYFNKYFTSTFNDSSDAHLLTDTIALTHNQAWRATSFNINKNEYVEIWLKVFVDSSMANKIIGLQIAKSDFTIIFWDKNIVISLGNLDVFRQISEPNKIRCNVYPINSGAFGWHNLIIRQISSKGFFTNDKISLGFYNFYTNYILYINDAQEKEDDFLNVFVKQGFRFFLLCVIVVCFLFYFLVQKTTSFLWFSIFSLCLFLLSFEENIFYTKSIYSTIFNNILICFTVFAFLSFVFNTFLGKRPKRINWYLYFSILIAFANISHQLFDVFFFYPFLAKITGYAYFLLLSAIILESLIAIIYAIKNKKRRILIIALGILQILLVLFLATFVTNQFFGYIMAISVYLLPVSFIITFIYIIKDSFSENISRQAEVLTLMQSNEKILSEQNITLEKKVLERTLEVQKQKELAEDLLLNILPSEVAEELMTKGSSEAKQFDDVTVLLTDFVNFTGASEKLTPKELVSEIHQCFTAFDEIIGRNGLEKIKTTGDAYMAVCGLPNADGLHAIKAVTAALEILHFMSDRKKTTGFKNGLIETRIGINSGSVVAGIVGVKKFAYDIWGDTVNLAARMEQNGEAGKINISGTTYELVKVKFTCIHRGKIEAKNKGEIDMYFVGTAI